MKYYLSKANLIVENPRLNSISDILVSETFSIILGRFFSEYKTKKSLEDSFNLNNILSAYKAIICKDANISINSLIAQYTSEFIDFNEDFYDHWRKINRYCLLKDEMNLVETSERLNNLVLSLYREIQQSLMNTKFLVYRQLPAGFNALLSVTDINLGLRGNYKKLSGIPYITQALIKPPFIINTASNTRTDFFSETKIDILENTNIKENEFCCYPVYVGTLKAYVYCHYSLLHHLVSLANLFEPIPKKHFENSNPDLICLFGVDNKDLDGMIFHDKKNKIYTGLIHKIPKNDYFGYMKKMLLTLHNLHSIDNNKLPIHGAMVSIITNDNKEKNIAIIGDSGAGKSETLEALRIIASDKIKHMNVVFDDMGTFKFQDNFITASGTEIGAFVRLDDLEDEYVYQEIDRAIFINPNQKNARVVLPISNYGFISKDYHVDMVLYANNYSKSESGIKIYDEVDMALKEFIAGKRLAKGTTSEVGLTKSFFANPFGPLQRKNQTKKMITSYFKVLFDNNIPIGTIYTKLAVKGYEAKGPQSAAQELIKYIIK